MDLVKGLRAAFTALSTSAASASATWQISSPVAGLKVGNVFPDRLWTHRLLIRILVCSPDSMSESIRGRTVVTRSSSNRKISVNKFLLRYFLPARL